MKPKKLARAPRRVHSRWSRRLAHGALRGAVAAMAMSGMRTLTLRLGVLEQQPPDVAARQHPVHDLLTKLPEPAQREALVELLHWAYGAAGGAAFASLPSWVRLRAGAGPAYGLGLWAGFEALLAPMFGLSENQRRSVVERAALISDHLLYGVVLGELRTRPQR